MFEIEVDKVNKRKTVSRDKSTYSIREVMQILDISRPTAYKLIKEELFKSVKIERSIRILKYSFDKWLDS